MHTQEDTAGTSLINNAALEYQLDILKLEMSEIENVIGRLETYSQNARTFSIAFWAGALALMAEHTSLQPYIYLTAVIPLLFWIVDARWVRFTKGPIIRSQEIHNFLNGPHLHAALESGRLKDFTVFDVMGKQYRNTEEYRRRTSIWHILSYRTLYLHYGAMVVLSVVVSAVLS